MDHLYFVHDIKGNYYGTPFLAPDDVSAVRLFDRLALASGSDIANSPEDFVLVHAFSFDSTLCDVHDRSIRVICSAFDRQLYYEALRKKRSLELERQLKNDVSDCDHEVKE